MKKKHRDIVVDDVQYGWITDGYNRLRIFKDKKEIANYTISDAYDAVTPKLVAALIKDPNALEWINALPCPFCGKLVEPSQHSQYLVCVHEEDCFLHTGAMPITTIHKNYINTWNKRH